MVETRNPQPKPWLDLFRTDFGQLRHAQKREIERQCQSSDREASPQSTTLTELDESKHQSPCHAVLLPSEIMHAIFSRLEPEHLAAAAQVCQKWLCHAYEPFLWRKIAYRTWPSESHASLEKRLYQYKTWRKLATERPRLRTNAIYVTRHQFAKTSTRTATEEPTAPVFLITYYRFLRFYNDGVVVALTTPEAPHLAYKRLRRNGTIHPHDRDKAAPSIGTYTLDEYTRQVVVTLSMAQPRFPDMRTGTMCMVFSLEETRTGACNRLFLLQHYAIMEQSEGELISYLPRKFNVRPFRLVPLLGFRSRVYQEFPTDDERDLAQWAEMKRASRAARRSLNN